MRSVCVFCGPSVGRQAIYKDEAVRLGRELVKRNITLIYGGGSIGLMNIIAETVLLNGGKVVGVIPQKLYDNGWGRHDLTELVVVDSMHERKVTMMRRADSFIALPGGYGTIEEIFEAVTLTQLKYHRKACGLLNIAGYFDSLVSFLNRSVKDHFITEKHRAFLLLDNDSTRLLDQLEVF